MKSLKNNVYLIGNLGSTPEVKNLDGGKKRALLSLATSDSYKNQKGELEKTTQWHRIVAWGKLAEIMEKYLQKGSEIALQGQITYRKYEDKDGQTRYSTEIVANELLMLGHKNKVAQA